MMVVVVAVVVGVVVVIGWWYGGHGSCGSGSGGRGGGGCSGGRILTSSLQRCTLTCRDFPAPCLYKQLFVYLCHIHSTGHEIVGVSPVCKIEQHSRVRKQC